MGTSKEQAEFRHSKALLVSALFGVGLVISVTLLASLMSRYFWVEDSGVQEGTATFNHLVSATPSEQGLFAIAGLLIVLGAMVWIWRPDATRHWRRTQD